jgi:hypothetical protein
MNTFCTFLCVLICLPSFSHRQCCFLHGERMPQCFLCFVVTASPEMDRSSFCYLGGILVRKSALPGPLLSIPSPKHVHLSTHQRVHVYPFIIIALLLLSFKILVSSFHFPPKYRAATPHSSSKIASLVCIKS